MRLATTSLLAAALLACSDGSQPADTGADVPGIDRAAPRDQARAPDRGGGERAAVPDYGVVTSCASIGSKDCFANLECAADQRCRNVGTESDPVACCVLGPRGAKAAGELCASEDDCASGVCIAKSGPSRCSKDCASAADCPTGMKQCIAIAMSGSPLKWCFPES